MLLVRAINIAIWLSRRSDSRWVLTTWWMVDGFLMAVLTLFTALRIYNLPVSIAFGPKSRRNCPIEGKLSIHLEGVWHQQMLLGYFTCATASSGKRKVLFMKYTIFWVLKDIKTVQTYTFKFVSMRQDFLHTSLKEKFSSRFLQGLFRNLPIRKWRKERSHKTFPFFGRGTSIGQNNFFLCFIPCDLERANYFDLWKGSSTATT